MWSLWNLWPFKKNKQSTSEVQNPSTETQFLQKLAQVRSLAAKQPMMDGAALVVRISHGELICELIVEVRLPGWRESHSARSTSKHGFLWVYLQNASDEPLKLHVPEFILTGALKLPWKTGLRLMLNPYRGEYGEVLSWQVPITGNEDLELLASEVVGILNKCRKIMSDSR